MSIPLVLLNCSMGAVLGRWAIVHLVALGSMAMACGASMPPSYGAHPLSPTGAVTKPLPEIKRHTIDGGTFDSGQTRGRVTVVKFFAKYCAPCKTTLPWFEKFVRDNPKVAALGIAEDERESDVLE